MQNLTPKNIKEKTSQGLTFVDFWADWCTPCKVMEPVMEKLAQKYEGQIKFAKVDVEKYQALAEEYNIMNIPAMILFKDGVPKEKVTGDHPAKEMEAYLDSKIEG